MSEYGKALRGAAAELLQLDRDARPERQRADSPREVIRLPDGSLEWGPRRTEATS